MNTGYIHIYMGDGKGKTTAAMGLCLRAAGHGLRVGIAQFLKPDSSGEIKMLSENPAFYIFPYLKDVKFTFLMNQQEKQEAKQFYSGLLDTIISKAGQFDVILLDEVFSAASYDLIDVTHLIEFLKTNSSKAELILTGHNPPPEIVELADYVSEIKLIKHPYQKGIQAREGIEW